MEQNIVRPRSRSWVLPGFALLVFGCMYLFVMITAELGNPGKVLFALLLGLAVTAYVWMTGRVLKLRFQVTDITLVQLLAIFFLSHFLPFLLDEAGNVHLFYADDVKKVMSFTLPALLNSILCGIHLTRGEKTWGQMGTLLWRIVICLTVLLNPFQAVILISLLCVRVFFSGLETIRKNFGRREPFVKAFLAANRETFLFLLVWCVALALAFVRGVPVETEGNTGLFDGLRSFRSSTMNVFALFRGGIVAINLTALVLGVFRFVRNREGRFLYWQLEGLFCMGFTVVCLALLCTQFGDRYLVYPEVMLTWMGWLLLMTVSSLAYVIKTLPKTGLLLPLLTYMVLCETFLNPYIYGKYTLADALSWGFGIWG